MGVLDPVSLNSKMRAGLAFKTSLANHLRSRPALPGRGRKVLRDVAYTLLKMAQNAGLWQSRVVTAKSGTVYVHMGHKANGECFSVRLSKDGHPGAFQADWEWSEKDSLDKIVQAAERKLFPS